MSGDDTLVCNFKKCRKRVNSYGWVTSCSHVFCDEDGGREFNKACVCPACESQLPGKYDIIRVDLQPSEEYKSMILVGQRPETVMEIASRALSFWTYQAHQERTYQEYCSTKAKERLQQLEGYYEQCLTHTQAELSAVKAQIEVLRKELDNTKLKYNESSEKLLEKSRQYQKLQTLYDSLRRKNITLASFEGSTDHLSVPVSPRHHFPQAPPPPLPRPLQNDENILGMTLTKNVNNQPRPFVPHNPPGPKALCDPTLAAAVTMGSLHQTRPPPTGNEGFNIDINNKNN